MLSPFKKAVKNHNLTTFKNPVLFCPFLFVDKLIIYKIFWKMLLPYTFSFNVMLVSFKTSSLNSHKLLCYNSFNDKNMAENPYLFSEWIFLNCHNSRELCTYLIQRNKEIRKQSFLCGKISKCNFYLFIELLFV